MLKGIQVHRAHKVDKEHKVLRVVRGLKGRQVHKEVKVPKGL